MWNEFKSFLMRGNVIDLAVAVIIGGAFNKIVEALVDKLIMPIIGMATGGINFEKEVIKVGDAELGWGAVFQNILQFIIVGFVLYLILKAYNTANKSKAEDAPAPTPTETLLADIKGIMQRIEDKTK
jgi:large conductance mechanosensitive channel